jgi:hypothetical protein
VIDLIILAAKIEGVEAEKEIDIRTVEKDRKANS